MITKLAPCNDNVLIRPVEAEKESPGGIALPESLQEREDDILFRVLGQHSPHLSWPMPGPVKLADRRMVVTEKRDLFAGTSPAWPAYSDVKPYRERDRPLAGR